MKKLLLIAALVGLTFSAADAQHIATPVKGKTEIKLYEQGVHSANRTEIILPQIKGYTLYKADFHMHTIYSDGEVTPRERVREAWYNGLDIIAMTDHLEIRSYEKFMLKTLAPYSKDGKPFKYEHAGIANKKDKSAPMLSNLNAAYDEAVLYAKNEKLPILLVRGTEIWRNPRTTGEYNALFLKDITAICTEDLFECFQRVKDQGGLIMHNHPGWRRKTMEMSEDQVRAYGEGWVDGVEVVNGTTLYPQMIDRCVENKLFIASNTDMHRPAMQLFNENSNIFRTMTFVLAKECTEDAIKDALKKRRTIGYVANNLIGEEMWLKEFLNEAVICKVIGENEKKGNRTFQLTNTCSVPFLFRRGRTTYMLEPFHSIRINFGKDKESGKYLNPELQVDNMWTVGDKHPKIAIKIDK